MSVSIKWKEYDLSTNSLIEKNASDQPTLQTLLYEGSSYLFDGKFSTLSGSDVESFPFTGSIGNYRKSVIVNDSSITGGQMLKVFGSGFGVGTKYFRNNNTAGTVNKCVVRFPIQEYDDRYAEYPITIFETETVDVIVESVTKQTAAGYTGFTYVAETGIEGHDDAYAPTYNSTQLGNMIHKANVKVVDKTLDTFYTVELYCINFAGQVCRFGDSESEIVITLLCLDNYNPKYICDSVNTSGYVRDLTDTGQMLQTRNGVTEYSSNSGILSTVLLSFITSNYTFNVDMNEYFSPASVSGGWSPVRMFERMYDPLCPFKIKPESATYPSVTTSVQYYTPGSTSPDLPIDWKDASQTSYSFTINYIQEWGFRVMARHDENDHWYIGNVISNYAEPVPIEPDPINNNPAIVVDLPDDYTDNPPTPPSPQTDDLFDKITGYPDGVQHDNNYDVEVETDSEYTDGWNNWAGTGFYPSINHNFTCYIGSESVIAELGADISDLSLNTPSKLVALLNPNFDPGDVISTVIEIPYNIGTLVHTINKCPMCGGVPLCRDVVDYGNLTSDQKDAIDDIIESQTGLKKAGSLAGLKTLTNLSLRVGTAKYYPTVIERIIKIDYGTRTIKRVFGNYLDYEMMTYKLQLPLGQTVVIDPQLLFRNKEGESIDASDLTINGLLDIESGDVLITVLINDDLFYQTTINVACTRSLYTDNEWAQARGIMQGLGEIAKGVVQIAGAPTMSTNIGQNAGRDNGWSDTTSGGYTETEMANDISTNSESFSDTGTFFDRSPSYVPYEDGFTHAIKDESTGVWNVSAYRKQINPPGYKRDRTLSNHNTNTHTDNTMKNNQFMTNSQDYARGSNSSFSSSNQSRVMNPISGAGSIMSGIASIAGTAATKPITFAVGQSQGSVKILSNLLPIFIYEYPDVITPYRKLSYYSPWDYDFDYVKLHGLPSMTYKIGQGYNKYGSIFKINVMSNWRYTMNELSALEGELLNGFYISDSQNIYMQPSQAGAFYNNVAWETQPEDEPSVVNLYHNNTRALRLVGVETENEKYADKLYLSNTQMTGAIRCDLLDNSSLENPSVTFSAELYTGQNYVLFNCRCYRVVTHKLLIGNIIQLILQEDYLSTWYNRVVIQGLIVRSTSYYNSDIHDVLPMSSRRVVKKIVFDDTQNLLNNTKTLIALSTFPTIVEPTQGGE